MNTAEQSFTEQWAFPHEVAALYPGATILYTNARKSAAGAPLYDWVASDGGEVTATHTLMVLKARKTGNPHAVVTREATHPLPSPELAAILKNAFT